MGYVWPLYDPYDIFKVKLDGTRTGNQRGESLREFQPRMSAVNP